MAYWFSREVSFIIYSIVYRWFFEQDFVNKMNGGKAMMSFTVYFYLQVLFIAS